MLARDTVSTCPLRGRQRIDTFALALKAEDKGDHWVLDEQKLWITNAFEAGVFIVFANANPNAGYKGITAFLVERDFPGSRSAEKDVSASPRRPPVS